MTQMKSFKHSLSLFIIAIMAGTIGFTSCNSDDNWIENLEGGAYIAVATIKQENGVIYLLEDDSTSIYPQNMQTIADSLLNKRVWFEFYKYNSANSEAGYDMTVHIFNIGTYVLTKPYFKIETQVQNDSIGDDPATIQMAWVTGKYLNIVHQHYGLGVNAHYINLVQNLYNPASEDSTKIHLEFRHNDRNEAYRYIFTGVSSFDISEFMPTTPNDTVTLFVTYRPLEGTIRSFEVKLH